MTLRSLRYMHMRGAPATAGAQTAGAVHIAPPQQRWPGAPQATQLCVTAASPTAAAFAHRKPTLQAFPQQTWPSPPQIAQVPWFPPPAPTQP
jgi:hypothetical protein